MYNDVPIDEIPLFLPVSPTVLLKTWFDGPVVERGFELLRQGALTRFFIYRHGAGCLFQDQPLYLVYKPTARIAQGFTIQDEHCAFCGVAKRDRRCEHIAALAILSIRETAASRFFPMPLLFSQSRWAKTADFLYDCLSEKQAELSHREDGKVLQIKGGNTAFKAEMDKTCFPAVFVETGGDETKIKTLHRQLQKHCLSDSERSLLEAGSASRGLSRDTSIWSRLCTAIYCHDKSDHPEISYHPGAKTFTLAFERTKPLIRLSVPLPANKTVLLLKSLGQFSLAGEGRSGSEVTLDDKGRIAVKPIVLLDDGRWFCLDEISESRFGNHYYFPKKGFISLAPTDSKARLTPPKTAAPTTPLFDFIKKDDGFLIELHDMAEFLERNREPLNHPDNRVAPEVHAIRFIDTPERLVIHELQEKDGWFHLRCEFGIGDRTFSLPELLEKIKNAQTITVGLTTFDIGRGPLGWLYTTMRKSGWTEDDKRPGIRLRRGEFALLIASIGSIEHSSDDGSLRKITATLSDAGNWSNCNSTIHYRSHLRDYQKNGLSWLHTLYELGLGGILADDMGLGKTHQALALAEGILTASEGSAKILIVCPTSVLLHWADKLEAFYPELPYALYYGPDRNLDVALQNNIVITTYGIARGDREQFCQHHFELILFDEVQALKNRQTTTHQALASFRGRVKFGLTGTPIENSLADLYALFNLCLPGFFGPFEQFSRHYLKPIEQSSSRNQRQALGERIHPFILRRSRAQVLDELPPLIEDNMECELSETQQQLYRLTLASRQPLLDQLADESKPIDYLHVLAMLTRLKQICNHPCLIENCTDPDRYPSGKWDLFVELLDECLDNNRKVVVFTQYLGMLGLMKHHLTARDIGFGELRGDMSIARRKDMITRFSQDDDCRVFVASLLAGGTGIDLLAGKAVIHYDRWWNPAKEEQATARVHRMGQLDVVQLFRLITKNTLEEKIDAIISSKKRLSDSIIAEDEAGLIKQLNRKQLLALFSF